LQKAVVIRIEFGSCANANKIRFELYDNIAQEHTDIISLHTTTTGNSFHQISDDEKFN